MIEIQQLKDIIHICEHILDKFEGKMVRLLPESLDVVQKYLDDYAPPLDSTTEYEVQFARIRTFGGRMKIRLTIDINGVLVVVDSDNVTFN